MSSLSFSSNTQHKKLDSHLRIRIFVIFIHPAVIVKNLGVLFDAHFAFTNHVCNNSKTCVIVQMCDLTWLRHYLTNEAAIQDTKALVSSCLPLQFSLQKSV